MTDDDIRERARQVRDAFRSERDRDGLGKDMRDVLLYYGGIADCVARGEYHREGFFRSIVSSLRKLGDPMDGIDEDPRPHSADIAGAAENAIEDGKCLWYHSRGSHPTHKVVSRADDLMRTLEDTYIIVEVALVALHEAVTEWIKRRRDDAGAVRDIAREYRNACADATWEKAREVPDHSGEDGPKRPRGDVWDMPVKVIRQLPKRCARRPDPRTATVCLWPDGTETHAVPSEDDCYNPYTGLVVCLVKRMVALRGESELAKAIRDLSRSNRSMRADEGMTRAAAHRLALIEVGSLLYATGMDGAAGVRPATFAGYASVVAGREVSAIANPMAEDFRTRLADMRGRAAYLSQRERRQSEYERRLSALRDEAVANGADGFEAWAYARDHAERPLNDGMALLKAREITEAERDAIERRAWEEARERIYGAGYR